MDPIPLRSVRPLIFKTICVTDLNKERVDLKDQNLKRLAENIERELQYEVEEMISEVMQGNTSMFIFKIFQSFSGGHQDDWPSTAGQAASDPTEGGVH